MTKPTILMIIEGDIATTQLLEQIFTSEYFEHFDFRKKLLFELEVNDFAGETFPIFVRCADPYAARWAKQLRKAGMPYLYYLDDNFWELDQTTQIGRYYSELPVRKALDEILTHAECIVVNSQALGRYLEKFGRPVTYVPPVAEIRNLATGLTRENHGDSVVGGFAGSSSRSNDLKNIWPVIEELFVKYPHFVFEIIGFTPDWPFDSEKVRVFDHLESYDEYISLQLVRNWDFGVAPLERSSSNYYKTNNKYREYGSMGVAGIYEKYEPYKNVLANVNGLLAGPNLESWQNQMEILIENADLRKTLSINSLTDIRENFKVELSSKLWKECLKQIEVHERMKNKIKSPINKFLFLHKILEKPKYFIYAVNRHGFSSAIVKFVKLFHLRFLKNKSN